MNQTSHDGNRRREEQPSAFAVGHSDTQNDFLPFKAQDSLLYIFSVLQTVTDVWIEERLIDSSLFAI